MWRAVCLFCVFLTKLVVGEANCVKNLERCQSLTNDVLNVHLVPHSHDDVGWLKSVDEYYYGVETAYFWKWWNEQPEEQKTNFKKLVDNGQIEMVNGAWSMNDEGATNYQSIVDQFTLGLRKINETLGECGLPKVGWQIDPFGHSREHASLLNQMGFYGLFIGRVDWRDKDNRINNKQLDFIWKTSANRDKSEIFTSIFPDFYTAPICFDILCGTALVDNLDSPLYNKDYLIKNFYNTVQEYATFFRTNNVLVPMGGDFHFQSAEKNYFNIDKLIKYFNEYYNDTQLFYSTPSCYIGAVNAAGLNNNIHFPIYSEDFFPHASDPNAMWNGYFSSRPNSKRNERLGNNILQVVKQLTAIAKVQNIINNEEHIQPLSEALGVLQHHDAITGTEKFAVSEDYTRMLFDAISIAEGNVQNILKNLIAKESYVSPKLDFINCHLANVSVCPATDLDKFVVSVYNPLEHPISPYIRIPVYKDTSYIVSGETGNLNIDNVDTISTFNYLINQTIKPKELVFRAKDIAPMGIELFYVQKSTAAQEPTDDTCGNYSFGSQDIGFSINKFTGLVNSVIYHSKIYEVSQEFMYYNSAVGNNDVSNQVWTNRASGAYIFRPNGTANQLDNQIQVSCYRGFNVDEVKQEINDWITQVVRVYKGSDITHIEFDWLVGPIPVSMHDLVGKEVISRFTLKGDSQSNIFYTDSNGREMLQRVRDHRSYSYNASIEPVAGNYYPVTSKITIKDESNNIQMSILNDRAQGGSSLQSGQIELMIHRRIMHDDDFGVAEALNEEEFGKGVVARGKHYLVVGPLDEAKSTTTRERILAQEMLLEPWVSLAPTNLTFEQITEQFYFSNSFLQTTLPKNIHILTFEPWNDNFILRLEHFFENGEDPELSKEVSVDLNSIYIVNQKLNTTYSIIYAREMTLGANQLIEDFQKETKLVWNLEVNNDNGTLKEVNAISIKPMEIKTFLIKLQKI